MKFTSLIVTASLAFPVYAVANASAASTATATATAEASLTVTKTVITGSAINPTTSSITSASTHLNNEVEVLHWWTSGSEARAVNLLKKMMHAEGHIWKDFAVEGRAGARATNTLRIRALSGNPPDAAQIKGPEIQEWGELGFLISLNDIAKEQRWNELVPRRVTDFLKVDADYMAVPFNIHRVNWLWANPNVFKEANADIPHTLDDFFVAADKIKAAGYIPLALGNEPWQESTLFESIALATMGTEEFRNAFIEQDPDALISAKMRQTLITFRRMKQYTDPDSPGRSWNDTTSLVIEGKAAMQMMGDWAKGELLAKNKVEGIDFVCVPAPGTTNQFSFNIDSFVFFKNTDPGITASQKVLAKLILDPEFQREFNLDKGSIPVRVDIDMQDFDACAKDSMQAFLRAATTDNLVPSLSHNMAIGRTSQIALFDVISRFFNDEDADIDETMRHIRAAVLADQL